MLQMFVFFTPTISSLSPTCSRPSFCAAPPSIILVIYMLLSPGMCWFPTPPAILKPSPVCVAEIKGLVRWLLSVKVPCCYDLMLFIWFKWFHLNIAIMCFLCYFKMSPFGSQIKRKTDSDDENNQNRMIWVLVCMCIRACMCSHLLVLWWVWSRWWSPALVCGVAHKAGQ